MPRGTKQPRGLAQKIIPPRLQVTVGLAVKIGIGTFIFVGVVVTVIVFFTSLACGIAVNKTNIENVQQTMETEHASFDKQMDELRSEIRKLRTGSRGTK